MILKHIRILRMAQKCILKSCQDDSSIILDNNVIKVLGRSTETRVKDKRCSKEQVSLQAIYEKFEIKTSQIGKNSCGYNSTKLNQGDKVTLQHGDIFELLFGQYQYKVEFSPEPPQSTSPSDNSFTSSSTMPPRKRARAADSSDSSNQKKLKPSAENGSWESFENDALLVFNRTSLSGSKKIACYDMDGTLITTSSGKVFPKDNNDWKIIFPEVPGKLKNLVKDGYKIVLFTNQAGVAKGKNTVGGIQTKIANVLSKLGVEAQALVATHSGKFRKPMVGMWEYFTENCNDGVEVDLDSSVYVGDAAGRPEAKGQRKKDHSVADRLYAINVGIPFETPEQHFKGHKPGPFKMPEFLPDEIDDSLPLYKPSTTKVPSKETEVIIMVGFPGSGKSFFCKNHMSKHYEVVNRDTLGTWQKCAAKLEQWLEKKQSVVVDNTNPTKEVRSRYLEIAKKLKIPCRCFIYDVTIDHAKHNNKFRELSGSDHSRISDMIYNMYRSKYEEPDLKEGFSEIVRVNFKPKFDSKENEKLYKLFLLEK